MAQKFEEGLQELERIVERAPAAIAAQEEYWAEAGLDYNRAHMEMILRAAEEFLRRVKNGDASFWLDNRHMVEMSKDIMTQKKYFRSEAGAYFLPELGELEGISFASLQTTVDEAADL